jgi:ribosomal protein L19
MASPEARATERDFKSSPGRHEIAVRTVWSASAMKFLARHACVCRQTMQKRCLATEASKEAGQSASEAPSRPQTCKAGPSSYPFSSQVRLIKPMRPSTKPLMQRISQHIVETQENSAAKHLRLFSKRNRFRVLPGSILQVFSYSNASKTSTTSFAGQVIAIRRAGVDTSFRLRALLARTGVEVRYNAASNMIQDIKVIARADKAKGGLKKARRPALLRFRSVASVP